jgi:eukaryotic-like serine/threonine-protein kinase
MENYLKNYSDVTLIFEGGQKKVYRATHPEYGNVALKIGSYKSDSQLERIKREVHFLISINSKFYPKNYKFEIDTSSKKFFIVEEFIVSNKITDLSSHYTNEESIVKLLVQLIDGLKILWDNNIVHRDLKPDNILITDDFTPKIIDLGIARFIDFESLTKTIAHFGPCTPLYASPEQLFNQKDLINMRTDFFSLGIIMLEMHLGFHPFHPDHVGNEKNIPENIVSGNYVLPSIKDNTSDEFCILINRLLRVEPFQRFRNYKILKKYLIENWGLI